MIETWANNIIPSGFEQKTEKLHKNSAKNAKRCNLNLEIDYIIMLNNA